MFRFVVKAFVLLPVVVVACSSSPSDSQSLGDDDSDAGTSSSNDGGVSTRSDAGKKTDGGSKANDGGIVADDDAGSIGDGWTTEPFANPDGLEIRSLAAHPTAARTLLLGYEPGYTPTVLAEWIDGSTGATLEGVSGDSAGPIGYVGDGSAYALDFSNAGGSTLYHLTTGTSGRTFSGISLGSGASRPSQVPLGPWPPRTYVGSISSTRLLAAANQTLIDLSPSATSSSFWPETDLPFANTAEASVLIDWLAFDPTDDTHALVGMHPETVENTTTTSQVASCTITNPFPNTGNVTCAAVAADQGLPTDETQVGGWIVRSSPTHVYVETNTSAEAPKLYRSDDGGAHFSAVSAPSFGDIRGGFNVDPLDYETAIFCGGGEGIAGVLYVTKDAAATWTSVPIPADNSFTCGTFDAAGTYFAGYGTTLVSQKF